MKIDSECLNRQINRLRDLKVGEMGKITDKIEIPTDQAMFYVGYLAAVDRISIILNTLPPEG